MKIWIVFGQTGEYSDHIEWMVTAYKSKRKAENRTKKLDKIKLQGNTYVARKRLMDAHPQGDLQYQEDYTDTTYYLDSVELED